MPDFNSGQTPWISTQLRIRQGQQDDGSNCECDFKRFRGNEKARQVPRPAMLPEHVSRGSACRNYTGPKTGDYTDILVRSPYGEIPWPRLSRLSDDEMKVLMIDVVNKTYRALRLLFDDQLGHELVQYLARQDPLPKWNEPIL
jgi:hypothetical protein